MTVTRLSGLAVSCAGAGFVATGLWGRREVRRTLERERIVSDGTAVTSGAAARSLAGRSARAPSRPPAAGRTRFAAAAARPARGTGRAAVFT